MRTVELTRDCARIERGLPTDVAAERLMAAMRPDDREMLLLWTGGQASLRSLARVLGCHSGTVSRRMRHLLQRLQDPATRTLIMHAGELPLKHREVAVRVMCQGEQIGEVARALGMPRQGARRLLYEVRGWAKLRDLHTRERR